MLLLEDESRVCTGSVWYDLYGIPSGGVTVVGVKAGILGILQAPLGLRNWVRQWNGLFRPLKLTGGASGDTFFPGKRRGKKRKLQSRRETTWHRERGSASLTVTPWDDRLTGDVRWCVCSRCKGDLDWEISIIHLLYCLLFGGRYQKMFHWRWWHSFLLL